MIGYCCKYAPVELIQAFGGEARLLDAEAADFSAAETLTHANLCCHAKALIQQAQGEDELVLTDCCDATRRAFDVLDAQKPRRFMFQFDLPHDDNGCARARFARELCRFAKAYGAYRQSAFSAERFLSACRDNSHLLLPDEPFIGILGARVSPQLLGMIRDAFPLPVVNLTCSGLRTLEEPPADAADYSFEQLMDWYAGALLRMTPCMRMTDIAGRRMLYENENLRAIVYHTVKFCDYYGFEYSELKGRLDVPLLKLESDYTIQSSGQLLTRLEAFAESIAPERTLRKETHTNMNGKGLYAGIDSGSTSTDVVIIDRDKNIIAQSILPTGAGAAAGADRALDEALAQAGLSRSDINATVTTGYGRTAIKLGDKSITEITCHAKGAYFLDPSVRTIIDIGGQDSKVIRLDENGNVTNFVMNDKCAAGTGRFLELMARTLELSLDDMSRLGLEWKEDVTISSMCTVFAESEVVSLIAENRTPADIIHGLNRSVATKTCALCRRVGGEESYMMTGGVSKNRGVVSEIEKILGVKLHISDKAQLNGALGAALFALELE